MRTRTAAPWLVGLSLAVAGLLLPGPGPASNLGAQEADVASAVRATLDAWKAGRHQAFVDQYHPDARGFFLDGGPLTRGFDVESLTAAAEAGFEADVTLRDLDVRMYPGVAVSVGYLEGTLTLPGGISLPGTWRYSETRVQDGGSWKIVQFHVSSMAEGM